MGFLTVVCCIFIGFLCMKNIAKIICSDWLLAHVCQDSLKALREKQQRTVYRLTLVKGWNAEDIDAYFDLFSVGKPDFVEIKGVTYCGS